jgi:hypothetical protein
MRPAAAQRRARLAVALAALVAHAGGPLLHGALLDHAPGPGPARAAVHAAPCDDHAGAPVAPTAALAAPCAADHGGEPCDLAALAGPPARPAPPVARGPAVAPWRPTARPGAAPPSAVSLALAPKTSPPRA